MTFVSVNKATGSVHDLSEVGIGSDRLPFLQSEQADADGGDYESFQGSHTLPRALSAKKKSKKSHAGGGGGGNPPDHVIITSRPADGGNSVRIQIGGAQQQQQQQQNLSMNAGKSKAAPPLNDPSPKRKYSLKEVEVEGLLSSSEEGEDVMTVPRRRHGECDDEDDQDEDMFDLNSLIEGAVDDEEEEEGPRGALESSQMYFRPVRDAGSAGSLTPKSKAASGRLQRVEDDQVSSEDDDLLSMAPNQGSMTTAMLQGATGANPNPTAAPLPIPSDTDGDFLDRRSTASSSTVTSAKSVVLAKPRVSKPVATSTPNAHAQSSKQRLLPEKPRLQLSSPLLAPKLKELQQQLEVQPGDRRSGGNVAAAADSDLDSISTTSASYVVNHSDLDSFVIEDQQQQQQNLEQRQHEMQHQQQVSLRKRGLQFLCSAVASVANLCSAVVG